MNCKIGFRQLANLLTIIILFLLPSLPAMAQKEDEAKSILDRTSQSFKQSGGIEADFAFTPYMQEEVKGRIQLMEECFCIKMDEMVTWFNGKTQWTYLPTNEEVNVSTPSREEIESINPMTFLSLYKDGYACKLGEKKSFNGKAVYEVNLKTENVEKQWQNITLYIDRTALLPLYFKLQGEGRDYHIITISNYKQGMNWKKEHFTFNPKEYPNAEVIDLR